MSVELSPGFFSLNNPVKYTDIEDDDDIVPTVLDVEKNEPEKTNVFIKIINFVMFTPKPCNCNDGGWSSTNMMVCIYYTLPFYYHM
jgi:hypothetical protein